MPHADGAETCRALPRLDEGASGISIEPGVRPRAQRTPRVYRGRAFAGGGTVAGGGAGFPIGRRRCWSVPTRSRVDLLLPGNNGLYRPDFPRLEPGIAAGRFSET